MLNHAHLRGFPNESKFLGILGKIGKFFHAAQNFGHFEEFLKKCFQIFEFFPSG
jgi:hypothetical protein